MRLLLDNLYGGGLWLVQRGGICICGGILGQSGYSVLNVADGITQIIGRQLDNNCGTRQQVARSARCGAQCLIVTRGTGNGIWHCLQNGPVAVCKESKSSKRKIRLNSGQGAG